MPILNIETGYCKNGGIANSAKPVSFAEMVKNLILIKPKVLTL
jgi:hypothetical protein